MHVLVKSDMTNIMTNSAEEAFGLLKDGHVKRVGFKELSYGSVVEDEAY